MIVVTAIPRGFSERLPHVRVVSRAVCVVDRLCAVVNVKSSYVLVLQAPLQAASALLIEGGT